MCFSGFTGEHCDIEASSMECHTDADCAAGHVCDGGAGMCFVAEGTCGAVHACDMDTTCTGNGRLVHMHIHYAPMYIHMHHGS